VISSVTRGKLLVFVVFVIGVLIGGLIVDVYVTRWSTDRDSVRRSPQQVNQQLFDLLELSAEQRQQFQSILESSRPDFEKLFAENRKLLEPNRRKAAELQEQTRTKIRAILTEEQVKKYNEFNEKRRPGPPGPPRPGSKPPNSQ
jgi:Spy/CpxP family protein refolding chaperone